LNELLIVLKHVLNKFKNKFFFSASVIHFNKKMDQRRMGAVQSNFHQSVGWISARQSWGGESKDSIWDSSSPPSPTPSQSSLKYTAPPPLSNNQSIWAITNEDLKEAKLEQHNRLSSANSRISSSSNESVQGARNLDSSRISSYSRSPSLDASRSHALSPISLGISNNPIESQNQSLIFDHVIDEEQPELMNDNFEEDEEEKEKSANRLFLKEKKVVQIGDAQICEYFIMGKCRYKSKCKRSHNLTVCPHCSEPLPVGKIACSTHLSRCWKLHHASSPTTEN
jgi:hypothetical protein